EAGRLSGGNVEAVWLTDKASDDGIKTLGSWGATKVWVLENAAFAPYTGEVWVPSLAELVAKESPKAIFAPVTSRMREFVARLAAGGRVSGLRPSRLPGTATRSWPGGPSMPASGWRR